MSKSHFGIHAVLLVIGLVTFAMSGQAAPGGASAEAGMVLGDPQAPLTIIEYSSLTCPHCARFNNETMPRLKKEWIDTGKAKLIFRDFPLDPLAMAASMVAHCSPDRFFPFVDALFASQEQWVRSRDPRSSLMRMAKLAGISEERFNACLSDQALLDRLRTEQEEAQKLHGIESTPSFIVAGKPISGAAPYETFDEVLQAAGG